VATADGAVIELGADGTRAERRRGGAALARVAASPGVLAVAGDDGGITLVAAAGATAVLAAPGAAGVVAALTFAPGGAHLLAGWPGGPSRVYRVADHALVAEVDGEARGWSVDGRRYAVAAASGAVILHGLDGEARALEGDDGLVLAVAFAPDRAAVATASHGGAVVIWDLATATPRLRIAAGLGAATAIAFTPDGETVVVGYGSGAVRTWPASIAAAHRRACGVLTDFGRDAVTVAHCR
jgi:WD40 repeat protein